MSVYIADQVASIICDIYAEHDVIHLARAAKIVRCQIFEKVKPFTGFPMGCQEESVPSLLLALIDMKLEDSSIKDQRECKAPAALSIAQLLKFNSVKHQRNPHSVAVLQHNPGNTSPSIHRTDAACSFT